MPTGVRLDIDIAALKRDYEEGTRWPQLEKKFGAKKNPLIQRLKAAGAKMRPVGRSANGHASVGAGLVPARRRAGTRPAPTSRSAKSNGGGVVNLCLTEAAVDALWDGLSLQVKGEWIEKILG